ncbi:MAG: CocE/NonD family hydrolase, partial [Calditrichia bacterium]|nr:CocE/NonD family hydrolase [Calditrichia bacterium]
MLIDSIFEYGNRYFDENYERFVYQVPMRDEVKLNTVVYVPKDKNQDYPIMFSRTPYSVELSDEMYRYRQYKFGLSHTFFEEKFIFVYQDVRGSFMSEGDYVNMRPQLKIYKNNKDIDENTDTYDTIEWLIKNISGNNGKVGMWGISYPGFYAIAGAINAHPALKAVSPQAPIADWFW